MYESDDEEQILAQQWGCTVTLAQGVVVKAGGKVRPCEEAAMHLVKEHASQVPVPEVYWSSYRKSKGTVVYGELAMSHVPGRPLNTVWADFDDNTKKRICNDIWHLVAQFRAIPRPESLPINIYCTTDGSPSRDPMLGSTSDPAPRSLNDQSFRDRIQARYVAHNGLSYRDSTELSELLPRSDKSVFTHGDISPRNIMVDEDGHILGLLDWEYSGWFPDYWEYAQMMAYCDKSEHNWQHWMEFTKPEAWDISGIQMARRVLF